MPTPNLTSYVDTALAGFGQLVGFKQSIEAAERIFEALGQAKNIDRELDAAIAKKRAELAASTEKAIGHAVVEGQRQRDEIIERANATAQTVLAGAAQKIRDANDEVEAKRQELADLQGKVDALKAAAAALAG